MRIVEYTGPAAPETPTRVHRPNAPLIGAKLSDLVNSSSRSRVFVAVSEGAATRIADAIRCLDPELDTVVLPPWDCLPYDRVPPSRQSMGRRMDAMRVWCEPSSNKKLMVTSLDALLQRVPPLPVILESWSKLTVGDVFDRSAFGNFVRRTGYIEDGIVDEPGELVFRDDVIDIFPAGLSMPMRIILSDDGIIQDLRSYDPLTQRTTNTVDAMVFGPACEAIVGEVNLDGELVLPDVSERGLFQRYGKMPTVFDLLGEVDMAFETGTHERLDIYLDIIDEARQARQRFDAQDGDRVQSLYLDRSEWTDAITHFSRYDLELAETRPLPRFTESSNPRRAFTNFVKEEIVSNRSVILAGCGQLFDALVRRSERETERRFQSIASWKERVTEKPGALVKLTCALDHGFADDGVSVLTVKDILGDVVSGTDISASLAEPEVKLGDVVVHEDHGIGVLKDLESVTVEGIVRDAARLEYRDGASVLVPMEEFGKIWRYGSEPEAVTLDRLHTEAWSKRRAVIDKDIRAAARHLLRIAKERQEVKAEAFAPPHKEYARFIRRFPYAETVHQTAAIQAVLQDLASGKVMNRLVCGDVGFGKTEIAMRAAAAVALAGGQVAVIAPTTVLARQHFTTFERRFSDTGVQVAMLSRVVEPQTAREVKERIANGEIRVVVATQAVLGKDVRFRHLGLLIVDEEHRFGTRDKQAMKTMAPRLHTLTMSATPIPRTLQSAMIGVQDVSILATAPSKRRPIRTSLTSVDRASMRLALLREHRRGGQSFFVVPQIEDIDPLQKMLSDIVPELSVRVAHGKMQAAIMDETIVGFADGDGDILLSTNLIESGLDVPRANTIFVWRADRFGLAQLHQLRGRVGRGKAQGIAFLLTSDGDEISEETRLRLSTMVENDRLGAGLAISLQDLDLRGAGDIAGDDQAGHLKRIGVGLYQKLLERSVSASTKGKANSEKATVLNLGVSAAIPAEYVPQAAVRLNLYARLLRALNVGEVDEFAEEFQDRFGDLPDEVLFLFRLVKLQIIATNLGIYKLDAGPLGLAITFRVKPTTKIIKALTRSKDSKLVNGRLIFDQVTENGEDRLALFETLLEAV